MKKFAVLCVAACATVLSVSQPARADWKPLVRNTKDVQFYYDENFTHPGEHNPNAIIARIMMQGHAPQYLIFSCFTTIGGVSPETTSTHPETLLYTRMSTADSTHNVANAFRVKYCNQQIDRNLSIMGDMNTRQQFMNDLTHSAAGWHR